VATDPAQNSRRKRRRRIAVLLVVAGVVGLGLLGPLIPWRTRYGWTCSTCGARKRMTDHLLWGKSYPVVVNGTRMAQDAPSPGVVTTPLTTWMRDHDMAHEHTWVYQHATTHGVFGCAHLHECGRAPPIYNFLPQSMAWFVRTSDEEEIRHLLDLLANDDQAADQEIDRIQTEWLKVVGTSCDSDEREADPTRPR